MIIHYVTYDVKKYKFLAHLSYTCIVIVIQNQTKQKYSGLLLNFKLYFVTHIYVEWILIDFINTQKTNNSALLIN